MSVPTGVTQAPAQPQLPDPPQRRELIYFGERLLILQLLHFSLTSESKMKRERGSLPPRLQNHLSASLLIHGASQNCSSERHARPSATAFERLSENQQLSRRLARPAELPKARFRSARHMKRQWHSCLDKLSSANFSTVQILWFLKSQCLGSQPFSSLHALAEIQKSRYNSSLQPR